MTVARREVPKGDYIECDWAVMTCVICGHAPFWFDDKMFKDPAFAMASHLVMKKHKDETGHDHWRNIPKWNDKDGPMPTKSHVAHE